VETVYLANMMVEFEGGNITFDQIEKKVLGTYGISTEKQIEALIDRFSQGFKKETQRTR
jgi:hypothetical protein